MTTDRPGSPSDSPVIPIAGNANLIAAGRYCECHRHPNDPSICLKVKTNDPKARKRLRADLAYFKKLHREETDLTHISDYLGPCRTDRGPAHLFECVTDSDGSISGTLDHYLKNIPNLHQEVFDALQVLVCKLIEEGMMVSDLHERNILLKKSPDAPLRAMIVDGLGDRAVTKFINVFDRIKIGKITRRWNRFIDLLDSRYPSAKVPTASLRLESPGGK